MHMVTDCRPRSDEIGDTSNSQGKNKFGDGFTALQ